MIGSVPIWDALNSSEALMFFVGLFIGALTREVGW